MKPSPARLLFFTLAVGLSTAKGEAQTLYATSFTQDQLITVSTVNGSGAVIGPFSPSFSSGGLGFRGGKLYAFEVFASQIRELNPATASTLNTLSIGLPPSSWNLGGLAFRSDGIGFLCNGNFSHLHRFDIAASSNTVITNTFMPGMMGLAFNSSDVLYGWGYAGVGLELYTINQVTGARTLVGPTGISGAPTFGMGGLAFDSSGSLFGALSSNNSPSFLYKVNALTGVATLIGNIGIQGVLGLSFATGGTPPNVNVTQSAGSTNVTEGGATDAYTVVLSTAPTANVTIAMNPGTQVTVVPPTLTFTPANWNVPQTVTVTAVDDALVEGPHAATIAHTAASTDAAYSGIAIVSVTANITDNDVGPGPPPTPPSPSASGPEGSHKGAPGPAGDEGTFGFGGRARQQALAGPLALNAEHRIVVNVSHRQRAKTAAAHYEEPIPGWPIALSGLGLLLAGIVIAARRL
jgi:hypothetical protein